MTTWIFQANPDQFDIDTYLSRRPAALSWLVNRYGDQINAGDRVFLWRNSGESKAVAGVIAEMEVIERPSIRLEDHNAVEFWKGDSSAAYAEMLRVKLRLVRIAGKREMLTRNQCLEDAILRDLPNIKMANGTNYLLSDTKQRRRLSVLWGKFGSGWSRADTVAGLWVYYQTFGKKLSDAPGSPVSEVAILIGRTVSSVYNKLMNFRALDPRDERAGLTGASQADRDIWAEFYDFERNCVRGKALSVEFTRLWSQATTLCDGDADAINHSVSEAAHAFEQEELFALLNRYEAELTVRPARPIRVSNILRAYERSSLVIAIARKRASHCCEIEGCEHTLFSTTAGAPYTEIHHIVPLAEGGEDTIQNVACLCPSHHREVHHGVAATKLNADLTKLRAST